MGKVRLSIILALCAAMAGCATSTGRYRLRYGVAAWEAGIAERGLDSSKLIYPFRSTPELDTWAKEVVEEVTPTERVARLNRLQDALLNPNEFSFAYEETTTLTAAQAFARRSGNCLAFTALFISASRSVGLPTFLVSVQRDPNAKKSADLVVVNQHVAAGYSEGNQLIVYDFYTTSRDPNLHYLTVDDIGATAFYYNNRGGAAIRQEDYEAALHHLELAARLDPSLVPAWVNLGVARNHTGDTTGAMNAYMTALELAPGNPSALTNMAYIYTRQGKQQEARAALTAAAKGHSTPFALIALADAEIAQAHLEQASKLLKKARRLDRSEPDVYEAMARLAEHQGKTSASVRFRNRAQELREQTHMSTGEVPPAHVDER